MNEEMNIVLVINVAKFAVGVSGLVGLMTDHCLLSVEVPIAVIVGALDLAHLDEGDCAERK